MFTLYYIKLKIKITNFIIKNVLYNFIRIKKYTIIDFS